MNEARFETELIQYLSTGKIQNSKHKCDFDEEMIDEKSKDYVYHSKLWKYEPDIKTTDQLWINFKEILERHNKNALNNPLSVVEFNQVKKIISDLDTPYKAGQFLYGLNGVSQIEIDLDDGNHVFLKVFEQSEVGAGDTVYQIVNQIERPATILGKKDRRFDTTLLINGLPIIQIEEKRDGVDVNEALNQMHQYADENQYSDIYSTLQILVAITPYSVKYMANTTADKFNKDFAFHWQRKSDNSIVHDWKEFAYSMLSIPMAHNMATNFMILDGTKNKESLKVMRPYQVYATQNVLEALKNINLMDSSINKIGYVWHTTGSGKTITSFKTAWLANRMAGVDKVVFVADRKSLTKQTNENYRAYDPDGDIDGVQDTYNTNELSRRLKSKSNGIIVTSIQKLYTLAKRSNFKAPNKRIVFIVDEAHRSTKGESFKYIQKTFKHAAWIGYTGTPMFETTPYGKVSTKEIFGPLLHAYTIREAIADKNVLGFKVDFETTLSKESMKSYYKIKNPDWTEEEIQYKIEHLTDEEMDDEISPSFYDENITHVQEVVKDIFNNWRNRSNEGRYNALLTTRVGGANTSSVPMALMYFNEFQRVNELRKMNNEVPLKVAVTFSWDSTNGDSMRESNKGLHDAIMLYNKEFQTNFSDKDIEGYKQDVISRLNKTASDGNYLDIVIVLEQLLTGFDAPELNTLYVDKMLKGADLIQAYSRTNRIIDMQEKPWGRIVNYRWPNQSEKLMKDALAIYSDKESANKSTEEIYQQNIVDGLIAPDFNILFDSVKAKVEKLSSLTNEFTQLPLSENQKDLMLNLLREYSGGIAKLKQYDVKSNDSKTGGFNYDNPEELIRDLGMSPEQEYMLTRVLANELKDYISKEKKISFDQVDLKMIHVKEVKVNYDYLTELLNEMINEVHDKNFAAARETQKKIDKFATGLDNRRYANEILNTAIMILEGKLTLEELGISYPANVKDGQKIIAKANEIFTERKLLDFQIKWGLVDVVSRTQLEELFINHRVGMNDLDDNGQIRKILLKASKNYPMVAYNPEIKKLPKIRYRNDLRDAIYKLADELASY